MRRFFNGARETFESVNLHRHNWPVPTCPAANSKTATGELVRIVEFEAFTAITDSCLTFDNEQRHNSRLHGLPRREQIY